MLHLPNAVASVAPEMQPKLHFLRTPHPRQRISHAVCSFLKCSLSCISYVHRIRVSRFLMRCASCSYSLITVTSSYRICTCFPFTLCIQPIYPMQSGFIWQAPKIFFMKLFTYYHIARLFTMRKLRLFRFDPAHHFRSRLRVVVKTKHAALLF